MISLSLENFRNVESAVLEFEKGINILVGNNAQGKTNIVEALYFFAHGKSFRTPHDSDLIRFEKDSAALKLVFEAAGVKKSMGAAIGRDKKKELFVNGWKISRMRDFFGNFTAVLFCPDHLRMIKSGPSERRRFCDSAICQIQSYYVSLLFEYNKVLKQRAALLRSYKFSGRTDDTVFVWNERLASLCRDITRMRGRYIEKLSERAGQIHRRMTGEELTVSYRTQAGGENDVKAFYLDLYEKNLESDIKNTATSAGVHRDDIDIDICGKDSRVFASQGQQRSAVIALKLAEGEILREEMHLEPLYLFDDIMGELDERRRDFLIGEMRGKSAVITSCFEGDAQRFGENINIYRVKGGEYFGANII